MIAYAVTVGFIPAMGAGQASCGWWTNPMRMFYRRMWLVEHWPPHRDQIHIPGRPCGSLDTVRGCRERDPSLGS
ncbi:hypothetical protein [Kibdelosporangium philippinense]|uniref:hypothetical protein n=1 Tax=Kibdelosporangium philippinense TaxID=211113 RepID=UPI00362286F9